MTPERIVTAATITSGEKHDGKEMKELIEKSQNVGIEVEAVVGDGAYSEKENIEYTKENKIKLTSKLSKSITHGTRKKEFEYNKDANMYVCPEGPMAIRKAKNAELKNNYNYQNAQSCGLSGMTIQGSTTTFLSNMKRIMKLKENSNESQ